jgi:hypothetical protein
VYTPPRLDAEPDGDSYARRLRAMARVRKLLRLAEDQSGMPEGEAARAMADAILAEHKLSRGALEVGVDEFRHRSFGLGESSAWRRTLAHAIADYFDCVALYEKDADEAQTFGPEHMLPHVEYTFVVYMNQLRRSWRTYTEEMASAGLLEKMGKRQQLEAREAFCTSFVMGVRDRLEKDRAAERTADPVSWNVTADQRRNLDRWMRTGGVRWRSSFVGVQAFDANGYRAGLEAEVGQALKSPREIKRIT